MKHRFLICLLLLALLSPCALAFEYPEGVLHRGMMGHEEEIEFLQYQLFYAGYLGDEISEVDGIFGQKTEDALKAFQHDYNLEVNGIMDPDTKTLLDELWENSMEPQGGDEPYPFCYMEYYANGTSSIVLCPRHMSLYERAADFLENAEYDDETIEAFQSGIVLWLDEIDALYRDWMEYAPAEAELISNVHSTFMDYYRANTALWNLHYGSPSMAALDEAITMLSDHCVQVCCILDEARYTASWAAE